MNKRFKFGIAIVVMMLAIGFASVTTNLILNNNVKLGFNASNFDIYFSSATPEINGTATIDSNTRQSITYSTKTLKNVGDQAYLEYVVTNASTQYDANCRVEFTIDSGAEEYVTIEQTGFVENVPVTVNAKSNKNGKVIISLKKGSMEPLQIDFTLRIIVEPVGRNREAVEASPYSNEILKLTVNNRPSPVNVPKYDDETGTIERTELFIDVYTKYDNTDVLVDSYMWDSNAIDMVNASDCFEFIGKTGTKYSYKLDLEACPSDQFECGFVLVNKDDHNDFYNSGGFNFSITDGKLMQQANGNYFYYEYGKPAWATWFMNEGRDSHCGMVDMCD